MAESRRYDTHYDPLFTTSTLAQQQRHAHNRSAVFAATAKKSLGLSTAQVAFSPASSTNLAATQRAADFSVTASVPIAAAHTSVQHVPTNANEIQGRSRAKYHTRPLVATLPINIIEDHQNSHSFHAAAGTSTQQLRHTSKADQLNEHKQQEDTHTVGIQTDYRENETQTDAFTADYLVDAPQHSSGSQLQQIFSSTNKQVDPAQQYTKEMLALQSLTVANGMLPASVETIEYIHRLREKQEWERTLPSLMDGDPKAFDKRKRMLEEREWYEHELRSAEIASEQAARLDALIAAMHQREEQRDEFDALRLEVQKQRFAGQRDVRDQKTEKNAIKAQQQWVQSSIAADKTHTDKLYTISNHQQPTPRDIIGQYSDATSHLYAPLKRDGQHRFQTNSIVDYSIPTLTYYSGLEGLQHTAQRSVASTDNVQLHRRVPNRPQQKVHAALDLLTQQFEQPKPRHSVSTKKPAGHAVNVSQSPAQSTPGEDGSLPPTVRREPTPPVNVYKQYALEQQRLNSRGGTQSRTTDYIAPSDEADDIEPTARRDETAAHAADAASNSNQPDDGEELLMTVRRGEKSMDQVVTEVLQMQRQLDATTLQDDTADTDVSTGATTLNRPTSAAVTTSDNTQAPVEQSTVTATSNSGDAVEVTTDHNATATTQHPDNDTVASAADEQVPCVTDDANLTISDEPTSVSDTGVDTTTSDTSDSATTSSLVPETTVGAADSAQASVAEPATISQSNTALNTVEQPAADPATDSGASLDTLSLPATDASGLAFLRIDSFHLPSNVAVGSEGADTDSPMPTELDRDPLSLPTAKASDAQMAGSSIWAAETAPSTLPVDSAVAASDATVDTVNSITRPVTASDGLTSGIDLRTTAVKEAMHQPTAEGAEQQHDATLEVCYSRIAATDDAVQSDKTVEHMQVNHETVDRQIVA